MNNHDGRYALDCWVSVNPGEAEPDQMIFSDHNAELDVLVLEANRLIGSREFGLIELCERQPDLPPDGWFRITRFLVPEQLRQG
jgi:hypothetical protein